MKKAPFVLGLISVLLIFAGQAYAATSITVTNGRGYYATNFLSFYDAKGVHLILDGNNHLVTLTYPDQQVLSFPYSLTVSGLVVKGSWKGKDEWGYSYTASATETLAVIRVGGGSGRGGGYHSHLVTIVSNGTILYHYAGAYAPPLIAPVLSGTSTTTSITLKWTAASGGVPPYSYKVYDAVSGMLVRTTTGLTATLTGFAPETSHTYSIQTVDHAGRHIRSNYVTITTLDD